jgi:hypothetical protein
MRKGQNGLPRGWVERDLCAFTSQVRASIRMNCLTHTASQMQRKILVWIVERNQRNIRRFIVQDIDMTGASIRLARHIEIVVAHFVAFFVPAFPV